MGAEPAELRIHERLLKGIPTASAEAVELLLHPLIKIVRRRLNSGVYDEEAVEEAAIEALLGYVQRPEMYNPDSLRLLSFLAMAATRDYLTWLQKENRLRRGRVSFEFVEDRESIENYQKMNATECDFEEWLDLTRIADQLAGVLEDELPSEIDRSVLELMLDGERRTEVFAETMGLPRGDEQNAATVKRTKDRIVKKLERMRGRVDVG